jgi:glycosyltransferase involved in cell wall biosynthesis
MISVTILTKNNERTLGATLASVSSFPEVILFDTGSTDATLSIAARFPNVKIFNEPFNGFGKTHNRATALARYDWILSLDSDEVLSEALIAEIHTLSLNPASVYSVQRHNYFNGKQIKWCGGWHPDRVVRLYNRMRTGFSDVEVHEKILLNGLTEICLKHPLVHTPYLKIDDFLCKMQLYSTLFADQNTLKKHSSVTKALLRAWCAFLKSYLFKRGFLGGKEGLIISLYNSHTTFYKYLKLCEKNNSLRN